MKSSGNGIIALADSLSPLADSRRESSEEMKSSGNGMRSSDGSMRAIPQGRPSVALKSGGSGAWRRHPGKTPPRPPDSPPLPGVGDCLSNNGGPPTNNSRVPSSQWRAGGLRWRTYYHEAEAKTLPREGNKNFSGCGGFSLAPQDMASVCLSAKAWLSPALGTHTIYAIIQPERRRET